LPLAEEVGGAVLVHALLGQVWLGTEVGELQDLDRVVARAIGLAEELGVAAEICRCLNAGAAVASLLGRLDQCVEYVQRSVALARASGDLEEEQHAVGNLGVAFHLRGDATRSQDDYRAAADSYRRANELATRLGTVAPRALNMANLGQVLIRLGERDGARVALDEALRIALAQGLRPTLTSCLAAEADFRLTAGEIDFGLAILGAVLAQEELTEDGRQDVDRIVARCGLSPDLIEAGMAMGRSLDVVQLSKDLSDRASVPDLSQSSIAE
jgi:tetratricopeptide (TPR) repeat protein